MTISGFVAYVKQAWKNKPDTSTPLSAARLTHVEEGVKANSDAIAKIAAAVINQQANDVNKIPSSALMYSVNEKVDSAISDLGDVKTDISLQPVTGIDILSLTTGHYYATNCTNLPTGWLAAYLDVERLDNKWCRITAWPPYPEQDSPQITKQSTGTWGGWKHIMSDQIGFLRADKIEYDVATTSDGIYWKVWKDGSIYQFSANNTGIHYDKMINGTWTNVWNK